MWGWLEPVRSSCSSRRALWQESNYFFKTAGPADDVLCILLALWRESHPSSAKASHAASRFYILGKHRHKLESAASRVLYSRTQHSRTPPLSLSLETVKVLATRL